jgi:hypothetical protein
VTPAPAPTGGLRPRTRAAAMSNDVDIVYWAISLAVAAIVLHFMGGFFDKFTIKSRVVLNERFQFALPYWRILSAINYVIVIL